MKSFHLSLLLPFLSHAEPKSDLTPQFLQLVQGFLNLYNTSHPSPKFQEKLQSHLFDSLQQMPNAHMLTLPIISAGVCVYVCRYARFTNGCTGGLLVESWAHNPEDTSSDPRQEGNFCP